MRLIHLLSISSLVWLLYCMYGSYVYILYLFEKIFFHSYCRKIIDKQHFPYIFRPLRYFGGVTLMSFNHLSLISS